MSSSFANIDEGQMLACQDPLAPPLGFVNSIMSLRDQPLEHPIRIEILLDYSNRAPLHAVFIVILHLV